MVIEITNKTLNNPSKASIKPSSGLCSTMCLHVSHGRAGSVFSVRPLCSMWPGYPELVLE